MRKLFIIILCLIISTPCWGAASRSFDGISDSVDFASTGLTVGTDSFTACVWFYWTDGADTDEILFSQQDGTGTGRNWLYINEPGDILESFLGGATTSGSTVITTGSWYWACVVSNEGAGTVEIFLNNVSEGSNTRTVEAATGNHRIGVAKTATTTDFEGFMAYGFVTKFAMTLAQITEVSYCPMKVFGMGTVNAFLPLWGDSTEADLSGNGNTGTVTGATTSSDGPPISYCGGGK